MTAAEFAERVRHLFPGAADLGELADTLKLLRDAPAPAAVLISLRYYQALAAERAEEVILWRRRVEGKPALVLSPKCPETGSWGPPVAKAPKAAPLAPEPVSPPPGGDEESEDGRDVLSPRLRFRAARQRLGLSQADLAQRLQSGWTAAMISQVETARRPCSDSLISVVEGLAS